jgi:hypothetical protein
MRQPLLIPIIHEDEAAYQLIEEFEGIPKGLVVDGASIPRLLWSYKPPDGIHRGPALHHDRNYINKGFNIRTRKHCDDLFRAQLLCAGLGSFDAFVMWSGVRLGGWRVWNRPFTPPIILPVRNAAPTSLLEGTATGRRIAKQFKNHLYSVNP